MKKTLLILLAIFSANILFAQRTVINSPKGVCTDPLVTITMTDIGTTSFTAQLVPNAECASFSYIAMSLEEIDMWTTMMGMTVDQLIPMWGISATAEETHTWNDMTPNTTYKVLALPVGADGTTYPYCEAEFTTNTLGGTGTSTISVVVDNIGDTTAHVVFTPDENTALYYDGIIEAGFFNEVGADSALNIICSGQPFYEVDDWTWETLDPNTTYYAIALGQNAVGEWGDTLVYQFSTLGTSIDTYTQSDIRIYPIPSQGNFTIAGDQLQNGKAMIYSINGQLMQEITLESDNNNVNTSLPVGSYLIRILNAEGKSVGNKMMVIQ